MTPDDRTEVREMLTDIVALPLANINGQLRLLNNQVANVEIQTRKTNGGLIDLEKRVSQTEKDLITHPINCAVINKIDKIEKIDDINDSIKSLAEMYDRTLDAAEKAVGSVDLLKLAEEAKQRSKKDSEERERVAEELKARRSRDTWQRVIWVIMAVIAVCSIWVAIYLSNKAVVQKVEEKEGVSKVTRGGFVPYVDEGLIDSIKIK